MAGTDQQLARIAEVEKKYTNALMRKKHVLGITIGPMREDGKATGEFALIILVDEKLPLDKLAPEDQIPSQLDGVSVIVHEVGIVKAL